VVPEPDADANAVHPALEIAYGTVVDVNAVERASDGGAERVLHAATMSARAPGQTVAHIRRGPDLAALHLTLHCFAMAAHSLQVPSTLATMTTGSFGVNEKTCKRPEMFQGASAPCGVLSRAAKRVGANNDK
jgi:hypothetical protein